MKYFYEREYLLYYKDVKLDAILKSWMTCMNSYLVRLLQSHQQGLEELVATPWMTGVRLVQGRRHHLSLSLLMLLAPCMWKASLPTALAEKFPVSFSTC